MLIHDYLDYRSWVRFIRQPDIRYKIGCRKSQKKRRIAKRRGGKQK